MKKLAAAVLAVIMTAFTLAVLGDVAPSALAQTARQKAAPQATLKAPPPGVKCAEDQLWDGKAEKCAPRCAAPLLYDSGRKACTCGAEDRRYDAATKACVQRCAAPGRFDYRTQTCFCPVAAEAYDYKARKCIDRTKPVAKAAPSKPAKR